MEGIQVFGERTVLNNSEAMQEINKRRVLDYIQSEVKRLLEVGDTDKMLNDLSTLEKVKMDVTVGLGILQCQNVIGDVDVAVWNPKQAMVQSYPKFVEVVILGDVKGQQCSKKFRSRRQAKAWLKSAKFARTMFVDVNCVKESL